MIATETARYTVEKFRARDWVELQRLSSGNPAVAGTLLAKGEEDPREVGRAYEYFGQAYTARRDDEVVACAGIIRKWEGLGIAWLALIPPRDDRDAFRVSLAIRRRFRHLIHVMRLRRIEAEVRCGWPAGAKLVARLGFRLESVMPLYLPDGSACGRWVILLPGGSVPRETE